VVQEQAARGEQPGLTLARVSAAEREAWGHTPRALEEPEQQP
jgi:hypothetical protein